MKKTILSIGLCLTLLLFGCAQRGSTSPEATSTTSPTQTSDLSEPGETEATPIAAEPTNWSDIQGKIKGMYPAGGSKILAFADQISLYDLATGKIVGTASEEALSTVRCWTLDNGYVIAGENDVQNSDGGSGFVEESSGPQFRVIFYDASLKARSELDLSKLLEDEGALMFTESLAFSSDGNCIAYATMTGVYLYDRLQDKRTTLIDLTAEDEKARFGICSVEQVGFTNGNKSLAFKSQSFDVPAVIGKSSFDTIGTINTDGTGLTSQTVDGYAMKELSAYDSQLLIAEDFKTADGRVMVIDNKSGAKQIFNLSDNKEGGNIYGSDTGLYFASSISNKTGWTIRVYDTQTGKLVEEQNISNDGQELYGANDPVLSVLDKSRTCIVLLGSKQESVDTKIEMFSF